MKRIVLVVLSLSSLHAMDHNQNQTKPATQKKEAHEQNIQSQIQELSEKLKKLETYQRKSHNSLVASFNMFVWVQRTTAINIHTCLAAKDQQIAALNQRVQALEAVSKFHASVINYWFTNEQMLTAAQARTTITPAYQPSIAATAAQAAAPQNASPAQPQSVEHPKLTITVSGPDDQAPITLLK